MEQSAQEVGVLIMGMNGRSEGFMGAAFTSISNHKLWQRLHVIPSWWLQNGSLKGTRTPMAHA